MYGLGVPSFRWIEDCARPGFDQASRRKAASDTTDKHAWVSFKANVKEVPICLLVGCSCAVQLHPLPIFPRVDGGAERRHVTKPHSTVPASPNSPARSRPNASLCLLNRSFQKCDHKTVSLVSPRTGSSDQQRASPRGERGHSKTSYGTCYASI